MQLCFLSYACLFPAPAQSQESSSLVLSQTFTVLDISETASSVAKERQGPASPHIRWLAADVCSQSTV
jgi:hypothetical protein